MKPGGLMATRATILARLVAAFTLVTSAAAEEPVAPDADFTAREISQALFKAKPGERLDFSGRDLTYLDLSGLDFKGASLRNTDLYGTDFTGANLAGTDLSNSRLDRSVLIRTDLSGANLTKATILRPTLFSDMANNHADAPKFSGAILVGIRVSMYMEGSIFRGADLTRADFSPLEYKPGQGTLVTPMRNFCRSCDFSGARLEDANFSSLDLRFSSLVGADLSGANLTEADLSLADLSGANLTGANLSKADLYGANLAGVTGLDTVKGLDTALNFDKTKR
jgi:uncharacterized protein YjbI with pentapeptide repeats